MPIPNAPNEFLESVPSPTGNFCEKFIKALRFPLLVYNLVSYIWQEDGNFTEDFAADVCKLDCFGGTGTPGGGASDVFGRPVNVSASDGTYNDKVRVTWTEVVEAIAYDVYRNAVNDSSSATLIGSATTNSYDDTTAVPGITYYYWVRARSASETSTFSNPDAGFMATELTAITDLEATKGVSFNSLSPQIFLVFSEVAGADKYDFYVNSADDFDTATLFDSDRTPFDYETVRSYLPPMASPGTNVFIDNQTDLTYQYKVTDDNRYTKLYFWVVAKKTDGAVVIGRSAESNSADGWAFGAGDSITPAGAGDSGSGDTAVDTPAGSTKVYVACFGAGGGGAGGDADDGGAGGGGGALISGSFTVAAGSKMRMVSTPEAETSRAATGTNGDAGSSWELQYSADGSFTDTVVMASGTAPGGGTFVNGGIGTGGAGSVASTHASFSHQTRKDGNAGLPNKTGGAGGMGGHRFGHARIWAAWFNGFAAYDGFNGDGGTLGAGGGSYKSVIPALATGGVGFTGRFVYWFYA